MYIKALLYIFVTYSDIIIITLLSLLSFIINYYNIDLLNSSMIYPYKTSWGKKPSLNGAITRTKLSKHYINSDLDLHSVLVLMHDTCLIQAALRSFLPGVMDTSSHIHE